MDKNNFFKKDALRPTEEKTFNREFGNLLPIKDNYPKYVISMTPYMDSSKWEGIIHIPFVEFLKNGFSK